MFFYETRPTSNTGSSSNRAEVYWRDRLDSANGSNSFNGETWQYGHWGGTWIAEDANRPTTDDYTGLNLWSGPTQNLAALYTTLGHGAPANVTTYRWNDSFYGGIFDSSIFKDAATGLTHYNSWWRYYKSGEAGPTTRGHGYHCRRR